MGLYIDNQNLLCISHTIDNPKEYSQELSGYTITNTDRVLAVLHKKQIKQIHFKDIGSSMAVFYISGRKKTIYDNWKHLSVDGALTALLFFKSYSETRKSSYAFLYKYPSNNINILNTQLGLLKLPAKALQTEEGLIITTEREPQNNDNTLGTMHDIVSFLYILTLLYGKFDIKDGLLHSAAIHMPLFGSYLKDQNIFDTLIFGLQQQGIFLDKRIEESNNGIIYQLSITDYEVLASFAHFHKVIAKIEKISTLDKLLYHTQLLIHHLDKEDLLDETMRSILQQQVIKTLVKA